MDIAILGAGHLARLAGTRWLRAGHQVRFGALTPTAETGLGDEMAALPCAAAATGARVLLLALPWWEVEAALAASGPHTGRIIIDATHPLRIGAAGPELAVDAATSGAEVVQALAPEAVVFKSLNALSGPALGRVSHLRPVVPVAGPETQELETVRTLIADLGGDARHAGDLAAAALLEAPMLVRLRLVLAGQPPEAAARMLATAA